MVGWDQNGETGCGIEWIQLAQDRKRGWFFWTQRWNFGLWLHLIS
jgi:hypothetical protein